MSVFRDWSPPRPTRRTVRCPGCSSEYPTGLIAALGEITCGQCGTNFELRLGQGIKKLQPTPEALRAATVPPARPPAKPKRFRRQDASGKTSTSIRTSETELEEWREAAAASGETFNGWLRRSLGEAVELERANKQHPERQREET